MKNEQFKWPPKCHLAFRNGHGQLLFEESDRELDLSDNLMPDWPYRQRTVYFGVSTASKKWDKWNEENVKKIEELIRYDLTFDGFTVMIKRIGKLGIDCGKEFQWKLVIRF